MGIFSHWFEDEKECSIFSHWFEDDDEPCKDSSDETERKEVSKRKIYHCNFCGNDAPDYLGCPTFNDNLSVESSKDYFELLKLEVPKDLKEKPFICERCFDKACIYAMAEDIREWTKKVLRAEKMENVTKRRKVDEHRFS
jgi:hypothetical protein